jgi:hypothetical protein
MTNNKESLDFIYKLAKQGNSDYQYELGIYYRYKEHIRNDIKRLICFLCFMKELK